jgi:hypothetical protein
MKYATKSEESSKMSLMEEIQTDASLRTIARRVARSWYATREMGTYEAVAVLTGIKFYSRSTPVDWAPVGLREKRSAKMINKTDLERLAQLDPESTELCHDNLMNVFYPRRPARLEHWCLFKILTQYQRITEMEIVGVALYVRMMVV